LDMLDEIPTGWELKPLSALADYINGRAFKPEQWSDKGLPIIRIAQINNPFSAYNCYEGDDIDSRNFVTAGDLLFSWSATLTALIWRDYDAILNQHIFKVVPYEYVSKEFLAFCLLRSIEELKKGAHGTTMQHIKKRELDFHKVAVPPLVEQDRIAEILTSVDDSIRATEAVIAQAERVKRGLMEDLLTGGLGSEAIARGEVPEGWEVRTIDDWSIDIIDGDRGKEYPKFNDFSDSGYCLFLNAKNVTKNGWSFSENSFIDESRHQKLRKGMLERGDIVITTRGTIGNVAWYDASVPNDVCRINSGMAIFRNSTSQILTSYLEAQLKAVPIQKQIEMLTYGSAQPALTIKTLKSLKLPVPAKAEQQRIVAVLEDITGAINANQAVMQSIQIIKRGLMDDLLTGRVRTVL
jgi:type I restriction enzyme S subunit